MLKSTFEQVNWPQKEALLFRYEFIGDNETTNAKKRGKRLLANPLSTDKWSSDKHRWKKGFIPEKNKTALIMLGTASFTFSVCAIVSTILSVIGAVSVGITGLFFALGADALQPLTGQGVALASLVVVMIISFILARVYSSKADNLQKTTLDNTPDLPTFSASKVSILKSGLVTIPPASEDTEKQSTST